MNQQPSVFSSQGSERSVQVLLSSVQLKASVYLIVIMHLSPFSPL